MTLAQLDFSANSNKLIFWAPEYEYSKKKTGIGIHFFPFLGNTGNTIYMARIS